MLHRCLCQLHLYEFAEFIRCRSSNEHSSENWEQPSPHSPIGYYPRKSVAEEALASSFLGIFLLHALYTSSFPSLLAWRTTIIYFINFVSIHWGLWFRDAWAKEFFSSFYTLQRVHIVSLLFIPAFWNLLTMLSELYFKLLYSRHSSILLEGAFHSLEYSKVSCQEISTVWQFNQSCIAVLNMELKLQLSPF